MRHTPTKRQLEVLSFIVEHIDLHGRPPTLRTIGAHFGMSSTNAVNDHLRALERKKLLAIDAMVSCGTRPTALGYEVLGRAAQQTASPDEVTMLECVAPSRGSSERVSFVHRLGSRGSRLRLLALSHCEWWAPMSRADAGPHVVSPELAKLLTDLRIAERIVQDERAKVAEAQRAVSHHYDAHEKAKLEVQKICDHIRAEVSR